MKFEQEVAGFRPITITLETQEEAEILAASLCMVGMNSSDMDRIVYKLYRHLKDVVPDWPERLGVDGDGVGVVVIQRPQRGE